jgi:hypothetical protein
MSATQTIIGEHDVVTLRTPVDRWPSGTRGAVVSVFPSHMWVEIIDETDEWGFAIVSVPTEKLELVWKCPTAGSGEIAVD